MGNFVELISAFVFSEIQQIDEEKTAGKKNNFLSKALRS
jgi:hypothetical protein